MLNLIQAIVVKFLLHTYKFSRRFTYIQLIDWQAQIAAQRLLETGQITVIIQDNASVHKSLLARQQHQRWHSACACTSFFYLPIVLK